ncbi:MAG: ATP-binding cassette domain-containing protein [Terrimicrobiaceae bacterium]
MSPHPHLVDPIIIRAGMVMGRAADADLCLPDSSVSRRHAKIDRESGAWVIEDLSSRSGTYLNGHLFRREKIVIGDVLGIGPFHLRFDGLALVPTKGAPGASLTANDLVTERGGNCLLNHVSLNVEPGQFVGILGPSGAGKSTLVDALCGLRPADSGTVFVDGIRLYDQMDELREHLGYVPQDDIVPAELPVEDALLYCARLRLPQGTPWDQIQLLVKQTAMRVGLGERLRTPVGKLSGGQRKRVSVAAELLGRPRLLFLDEPTSGLDPATEHRMMETLRELSAHACTIFCTTHVVENAHLFDRLAVMQAGHLVFFGPPGEAASHFGVSHFADLYRQLEKPVALEQKPAEVEILPSPEEAAAEGLSGRPNVTPAENIGKARPRRPAALPILMARQAAILVADRKNLVLLLGQPLLIALLVTWVSQDPSLILFFAYVATLWFGCGNAAQEIVREIPMFRRERLIGLGRSAYLSSKFFSLSVLTIVQSVLMYGVMQVCAQGIGGSPVWQLTALIMTSLAAVAIGLAISAWARSALQAVMLVPLVLIPQILFAGFMPPTGEFPPGPLAVSRTMPSASAQAVMDVSLFWKKTISGSLRVDFPSTFSNLNRDRSLKNGRVFSNPNPALLGLAVLAGWIAVGLLVADGFLKRKERG